MVIHLNDIFCIYLKYSLLFDRNSSSLLVMLLVLKASILETCGLLTHCFVKLV